MEVYSRKTAGVIANDFLKFDRRRKAPSRANNAAPRSDEAATRLLEQHRAEMANDDGRGSYGTYKCPIF